MTVPSIGQAQAAQPPVLVEPPKPVEEAVARQPEATPLPIPVRVNTPISVKTNSWVELRAPNGDVLTQTYVRAGESYVVPAGIAYRITEAR
jgi:cytoskeleton protein RodZ